MDNKERTVTYKSKNCEHIHLEKIAPLWYWCTDCGKIFMIPFSIQYSLEQAVESLGNIMLTIKEKAGRIIGAEKEEVERENKTERAAIKKFKKEEDKIPPEKLN